MKTTESNMVEVGGYGLIDLSRVTRVSEVKVANNPSQGYYFVRVYFDTPIDVDQSGNELFYIQKWAKASKDLIEWRINLISLLTSNKEKADVTRPEIQNTIESLDPNP